MTPPPRYAQKNIRFTSKYFLKLGWRKIIKPMSHIWGEYLKLGEHVFFQCQLWHCGMICIHPSGIRLLGIPRRWGWSPLTPPVDVNPFWDTSDDMRRFAKRNIFKTLPHKPLMTHIFYIYIWINHTLHAMQSVYKHIARWSIVST